MNKKNIERTVHKVLSTVYYNNLEEVTDVLGYEVYDTFFDSYLLRAWEEEDGSIVRRADKNPAFCNINIKKIKGDRLHSGLFLQTLLEKEECWYHTFDIERVTDTLVFSDDFFLLVSSGVNNTAKTFMTAHCRNQEVADRLVNYLNIFKEERKKSFNYITCYNTGFTSNEFDLPEGLSIPLNNYLPDFPWQKLTNFCEGEKPGIFMLYGDPGCGKSMIIRKLISECDTDFYILDSSILNNITSTLFIDFLTDECSNCVLVLEDCEALLRNRDEVFNPFISALLNLTDGLLGDGLKLKFICTFNTDINKVDSALLRKGRLTGKYEFKRLPKDKANEVCRSLGLKEIDREASLADIYNQEENDFSKKEVRRIGF